MRCLLTGESAVDYLAPEQAEGWAVCVALDNRIVSPLTFPQPAAFETDSIALSVEVRFDDMPTMKLAYAAKPSANKRIVIFRKDGWHIGFFNEKVQNVSGVSVWVYGNASGDILEYVNVWGNEYDPKEVVFRAVVDWKGWKRLDLPRNKEGPRFWGLTLRLSESQAAREPLYFAKLCPSQAAVCPPFAPAFGDPLRGLTQNADFHVILEAPDGPYEVELGIAEPAAVLKDEIGFDVASPDGEALFQYQRGKKGGPWWRIPCRAEGNRIDLHFRSRKRGNAWLNALRLYGDGRQLAEFRMGFDPADEAGFSDTDPSNLIPNPGFEAVDASGRAIGWRLLRQDKPADEKGFGGDEAVARGGRRSLRFPVRPEPLELEIATRQFWPVGKVEYVGAAIDYTRRYAMSAWVRGSDDVSGSARLEMTWYRFFQGTVIAEKNGHKYEDYVGGGTFNRLGIGRGPDVAVKTGEWQRIEWTGQPPYGADHVVFRVVTQGEKGSIWLDDMRCDGFGDAPVEIVACQGGYHPAGVKRAIIAVKGEPRKGGMFSLYPAGKREAAFKKETIDWGKDEWGRRLLIADFTDVTTPGAYELEVSLPGFSTVKSPTVTIDRRHYRELIDKVRHYLYVARCGMEIPGWHKACHLDDAQDGSGKHWDTTGGWHDAGSLDKQMSTASMIIRDLATIELETPGKYPPVTVEGLELPDILDEAVWGASQLIKMQLPDGRFFSSVNPSYGGMIHSQNNIVGDYDDRPLIGPYGAAIPRFLLALSRVSLALKARGQDYARFLKALELSYPGMKDESEALSVDIDMWRLTGEPAYRERAEKRAQIRLANLKSREYYWRGPDYDLLTSLIEYALAFPKSKLTRDIKKEVRAFVDQVLQPLVRQTPYEHVPGWDLLFPKTIKGTVSNGEVMAASSFLCQAYRLLDQKQCLELADAQLQWIMGRNPMNNSMIAGVGYRFQMPGTALSFTPPAPRNGLITGAALNYSIAGNGKLKTYYSGGVPRDFPVIYTSSDVPGSILSGGEICTSISAKFLRTCHEIDRAWNGQ
ncbi:MAG: glycoside hydrolase family 9 protein [Kiritimatiellae bacterium]|nr:glycoside hydrolase family 9 protein [Kiritimatiellia bacterium]